MAWTSISISFFSVIYNDNQEERDTIASFSFIFPLIYQRMIRLLLGRAQDQPAKSWELAGWPYTDTGGFRKQSECEHGAWSTPLHHRRGGRKVLVVGRNFTFYCDRFSCIMTFCLMLAHVVLIAAQRVPWETWDEVNNRRTYTKVVGKLKSVYCKWSRMTFRCNRNWSSYRRLSCCIVSF